MQLSVDAVVMATVESEQLDDDDAALILPALSTRRKD